MIAQRRMIDSQWTPGRIEAARRRHEEQTDRMREQSAERQPCRQAQHLAAVICWVLMCGLWAAFGAAAVSSMWQEAAACAAGALLAGWAGHLVRRGK